VPGQTGHRLPHQRPETVLKCAACPRGPGSGCAPDGGDGGGTAQGQPGHFLHWGQDIGPCTRQVVQQQLENLPHPEHGYRACLGLLNLSRRYSRVRLERACERALAIRSINYQSIASILKQGLDQQALEGDSHLQDDLPLHGNVRGATYYQ